MKNKVVETQGLIAIMSQWQLEASELLPVIDKINKTADDYAVSSQDIVDGLNRVGAAAKNAGMTIEETIGAITVLREASGRSGKEVGVALNTIFSYMTRNKTINLMESLGIRVFEDEAKTTFRSIMELMDELASRWQGVGASSSLMQDLEVELLESFNDEMATAVGLQEEWNDMQQRDISQAAAGVRRRNFFISLMSRFSEIQEVVNGQLDASGYSMRENERTMGTLEKQIISLKAAAEQLAVAIGDAGLLDRITGLVTGTKEAIMWFNGLDDNMQTLLITIGEVTLAIKLLDVVLKSAGVSMVVNKGLGTEATVAGLSAIIPKLTQAAKGMTGLAVAVAGAGAVLSGFGAVLRGLLAFVGGPLGAVLIGLFTALGVFYKKTKEAREELEALPATLETMQAQFGAVQGLQKEYDELSSKVSQTVEEKAKLADVTAKLGDMFPEAISAINEEGRAISLNNEVLKESIRLKQEEIDINRQKLAEQFNDFDKSEVGKEAQKNIEKIKELEKQVKAFLEVMEQYKEIFGADGVITKGEQREIDLVRESFLKASGELNKFNQEQLNTEQKFQQMAFAALNANDKFKDLSDAIKNQLIKSIRDMSKDVFEAANKIETLMLREETPAYIERMDTAFKGFNKTAKETADFEELNRSFIAFRNEVITAGKDMGITGNQAVQLAYSIMETQDPAATAELKMWQLDEIIKQVGIDSSNMASAVARASNILANNVSAATMRTIAAHWDDIKAVKDRAKAYEILARAIKTEAYAGESSGLSVGMMGSTYQSMAKEAGEWVDAYYELEMLVRGGGGGSGLPDYSAPGAPGGSGSKGKEIDEIAEALKRLAETSKMFEIVNMGIESAMDAVGRKLNVANAEYDYLNSKIENGTATTEDYARMQELLARKIALLNNEQVQLTNANRQYQQQIDALTPLLAKATDEYERFKAAGDEEHMKNAASAVSALKSEMDSLSGAIASNTQKIWENKGAMEQLATSAYTAYYQQTMAWMSHMESIGRMNAQLEAEILAGIDKERLVRQDAWKLEEEQFQNRLDRLKEERDRIKSAYDARMRQYENEVEANERLIESKEKQADAAVSAIDEQIKAIQRLMDLLDDDAESEDREEAERQHNKKLAELAEERLYHELRTGLEHQGRIKEIDDEVAEEKRRWQLQQNDWARKDQKDAYQDQINALKEKQKAIEKSSREEINQLKQQNDRKKQEMQKFYSELENVLSDSNLRMMAASQNFGEQFIQRMRNIANQATQAFNDNYKIDSVISGAKDLVGDAQSDYSSGSGSYTNPYSPPSAGGKRLKSVVGPENYVNKNGRTYMWSQTLAGLLGYSATWNQADGTVTINGRKFTPAWNDNGRTYLGIREVAEALGYSVTYNDKNREVSIWDKAHDGAKVLRDGAAVLRHDERVLSPNLAPSFDRLAVAISRTPDFSKFSFSNDNASLERKLDAVIAVMKSRQMIVDKAVNIEHVSFEDRAGMQALGIEMRSMLTATG